MSAIVTTLVVLRRCMRSRLNRQQAGFDPLPSQETPQKVSTEVISSLDCFKKPTIQSWLLQSLHSDRPSFNSETDSIGSLESESDDTIDDFRDDLHRYHREESSGDVACLVTNVNLQDFLLASRQILSHLPSQIAQSLSNSLSSLFESWITLLATSQQASPNATSSGSFSHSQGESTAENSNSASNGKRRGPHDEQDEFRNSDNNERGKRQKVNGDCNAGARQKWACPYYQREPHRYCVETEFGDFRKCARSPGFDQVHRVNIFKEDGELEIHRRKDPACELKQAPLIEGLTAKQKTLLKPRDRKSSSDEERWNTIYKICFPMDEIIPSPYYVHYSREIAALRREVLEIVRAETESPAAIDANRLMQRLHEVVFRKLLCLDSTYSCGVDPLHNQR
ncbi:hypothetical protein BP6252_02810 [Coleophoma cylindrospora]|uniref:Uncharacterized protein n=1 Tax=Coleophoma cylindrospora TaxID=1849047 RepID=A0A3D8SFV0_9HELO|nr:hypothetical protein BP6252_02810 [Coleophoma cylindrospora]